MTVTTDTGPQPMAVFPGAKAAVAGHLVQGKPATDKTGTTIRFNEPDTLDASRALSIATWPT